MILEKTLVRIKQEISDYFKATTPIDMPGIAFIINTENESIVNCANIIKDDCSDIGYNWFATNIDSNTELSFLKRMIDDYNELNDVTVIVIPFPLPEKFSKFENEIMSNLIRIYEKLNTIELVSGITTPGTRIAILGITKELYTTSKRGVY